MLTRVVVYATLLLTGCATVPHSRADSAGVVLHVENYNWSRAIIYATRAGSRFRIGVIGTNERKAMSVPSAYTSMGTLELFIRFIGSNATLTTRPIPVARGQQIEVILRNYIPFSTVTPLIMVEPNKVT